MVFDIAYDEPTAQTKRYGVALPKPIAMSPKQLQSGNDENSPANLCKKGSPMQVTPFSKDKDQITRSPLKRSRADFSPFSPMNEDESPRKRPTLKRSTTFPNRIVSPTDFNTSRSVARGITGNLSKSLGSKATTVRNLFSRTERKRNTNATNNESTRSTVKASMLAMLLVHKQELVVVKGLVSGVHILKLEELSQELFDFFDGHGQTKRLLESMIQFEVQQTSTFSTLFRESSCTTKLMSLMFKRAGIQFLENVLHPHINHIVNQACDYEIDPNRIILNEGETTEEILTKNRNVLMIKCSAILDDIHNALQTINPKILHALKCIFRAVSSKWDEENGKISVNSFIFLRFICPCIVAPTFIQIEAIGRRALILVSKVLQSVSNNTNFGEKEDYMKELNDSLDSTVEKMNHIFESLQQLQIKEPRSDKTKTPEYYKVSELLQQKILFHQHAILPLLEEQEDISEFKEAISIFSNGKARQIMKEVAHDLQKRCD